MTEQRFGGGWTERKLGVVEDYLRAYATALRDKFPRLTYVDAFAGTGWRRIAKVDGEQAELGFGFKRDARGSALRALAIRPSLNRYVFNERDAEKLALLRTACTETIQTMIPRPSLEFHNADANAMLQGLCASLDRRERAVVFLDPFGMQVDWATVELLARTQRIDLWYLMPTMALSRIAPRNGRPRPGWNERMIRHMGDPDWMNGFYQDVVEADLFSGQRTTRVRVADIEGIEQYALRRLRSVFGDGVAPRGLRLYARRTPIFYLCFACSNPDRGARALAHRIAGHILKSRHP